MRKDLVNKKKKLLTRISWEEYRDLTGFVSKIYLAEYDFKVLMARKFSNLFMALLELTREEDGGRVRHLYEKKFPRKTDVPRIVSNRALQFIKKEIVAKKKSGSTLRILLVDDIIVHGRTLSGVYMFLKELLEEAGITDYVIHVWGYAESRNEVMDLPGLEKRKVKKICNKAQWYEISNEIIDIFYLLGQPYTSYIPNCRICEKTETGQKIKEFIITKGDSLKKISNLDMELRNVRSYAYLDKKENDLAQAYSVRLYWYQDLEEFILVPMVNLNPIDKELLCGYSEVLKDFFRYDENEAEDRGLYRKVIYVLSALWGWEFSREVLDVNPEEIRYDIREEEYNFGNAFLCYNEYGIDLIKKLFQSCNDKYLVRKEEINKNNTEAVYNDVPEIRVLQNFLDHIIKENTADRAMNLLSWNQQGDDSGLKTAVIGRFLHDNGCVDENRCMQKNPERNLGIPLHILLDKVQKAYGSLSTVLDSVLYAIDFGKGSIIDRKFRNYYMPFVHAGEQNYKYFENHYFPFLYGMYILEANTSYYGNVCNLYEQKKAFIDEYFTYWENQKLFYMDDDIEYLKTISVREKFQNVLLYDALDYCKNEHLQYAIQLANQKITGVTDGKIH